MLSYINQQQQSTDINTLQGDRHPQELLGSSKQKKKPTATGEKNPEKITKQGVTVYLRPIFNTTPYISYYKK